MKHPIAAISFLFMISSHSPGQTPPPAMEISPPVATVREAGDAVAGHLLRQSSTPSSYMSELALEGLLELARVSGKDEYRKFAIEAATTRLRLSPETDVPWKSQPFGCLTFALYESTGDRAWLPVFLRESRLCRQDIWRNDDGIVLHPRGKKRGGGEAILIDSLQEYSARMARAGSIDSDPEWFTECVRQFRLHRAVVRYPDSGLWSQGRGWIGDQPDRLSPGAWSRGHGWLIRGMEHSLRHLPRESDGYRELRGYLVELADALLAVQSGDGMWRCLLTHPADKSPSETSGTGMIAYHLSRALHDGHLSDAKYRTAANKALTALPRYVLKDGTVLNTSPGPGPLETEEPWLKSEYPPGDPHGIFALLFAASSDYLLNP